MDLDNMKISELLELVSCLKGSNSKSKKDGPGSELIGEKVIVRAYRAGVHFGTLKKIDGEVVELTNARRLWYWEVKDKQGVSLSDVALHGVSDNSKICANVGIQVVVDACEIMTMTTRSQESIQNAENYQP